MSQELKDNEIFSKRYFNDTTKHEDKPKFRGRVLKYLEDFVNSGWPGDTYVHCRKEMGINIQGNLVDCGRERLYVEQTFDDRPIEDILDFITVTYDSLVPHCPQQGVENKLESYIEEINRIFTEESMCYEVNKDGRVRYYPDDEFEADVKSTLVILKASEYKLYLDRFNNVLDVLYKDRNREAPVRELFGCIETFVLSVIKPIKKKRCDRLNEASINCLVDHIIKKTKKTDEYNDHDREALDEFKHRVFLGWVNMCHKYRHSKEDQENENVPVEVFNYVFSSGVSIFRFLLEVCKRCQIVT